MQYRRPIVVASIAAVLVVVASIRFDRMVPIARADAPAPTFSQPVTIAAHLRPNFLATGDFNEDGHVDLAVTNLNSTDVSILLANGNGGYGPATNYTLAPNIFVFPRTIAVGDFNGDAHLDYVAISSLFTEGNAFVRLGKGDGTFGESTRFVTGNVAAFIVAADFNLDGKLDFAVANEGGDFVVGQGPSAHFDASVSVLAGDGQGGFASPQTLFSYSSPKVPSALSVGDFNNDGLPDLAVTNNNSKISGGDPALDGVTILLNQRTGRLGIVHEIPLSNGPTSVINHDLDNDGELDLVVTGKGSDLVSVLLGDGQGDFGAPTTFPAGASRSAVAAGDFNGDGNVDLATTSLAQGLFIILGDGTGSFGAPVKFLTRNNNMVRVTDLNRDHKPDIALTDTTGEFLNSVTVLFNTSNFLAGSPWLLTHENTTRAVALDSVTFQRDPFRVCTRHNFSSDEITRVMLFSPDDVDAMAAVTAEAEDDQGGTYPLTVEDVQKPANSQLTQVVVKLTDSFKLRDRVWLTISVNGVRSNRVLVRISPDDCGPV
jgi:hypothetical protein